jgi:hypothetical protein
MAQGGQRSSVTFGALTLSARFFSVAVARRSFAVGALPLRLAAALAAPLVAPLAAALAAALAAPLAALRSSLLLRWVRA